MKKPLIVGITGGSGSGKTTLAKKLGQALALPVQSLDSVVWKDGWVAASREERALGEQKLIEQEQWIIEGVSRTVRESADYVIFLDVPRHICIYRCIKRNLPYLFRSRPELPNNCPEILIVPRLLKIIWQFPELAKPNILQSMKQKEGVVINTAFNLDELVKTIKADLSVFGG